MSLQLQNVTKKAGAETHLYDINLSLESGLTVLIGQTLAGKTSLMRLMAGLDQPASGTLLADGAQVTGVPVQQRSVAMVYQQFINYPSLTVYDNIASPLKIARVNKAEIDSRVREVASVLHLDPFLERLPGELSGGQQQRTAMARALVKDAQLLLFDEPLVNLDYKLREELRVEMREIFKRRSAIVVYATTEPIEALLLGGQTVVMDAGRVLQHGPVLDVYHNPATTRVAEVFSDPPMNTIEGTVEAERIVLGKDVFVPRVAHLQGLKPGRYIFGARANHVFITPSGAESVAIPAVTELSEVSGSETFIHVAHHGVSWVVQEEGVHTLGMGKEIRVYVDARYLFVFSESGELVLAPAQDKSTIAA